MTILRWLTIIVWTAYALISSVPLTMNAAYRLGYEPPGFDAATPEMIALMEATGWPQIALWGGAVLLYLIAAGLLALRRGAAFWAGLAALVLDLGNWAVAKFGAAYDAAFTPQERAFDYVILAMLLALLAGVWTMRTQRRLA